MKKKELLNLGRLIIAVVACQIIGGIASVLAIADFPRWYSLLTSPYFNPPILIFGFIWIVSYALMGIAAYLIWQDVAKDKKARIALGVFTIQLLLNLLWTVLFFGIHAPFWSAVAVAALWIAVVATVTAFWYFDSRAAMLMLPYLAWITFAIVLNFFIFILNPL